jgi:maltose phosphorylase
LSKRLAFDERAIEPHWSAISKEMYYPKLSDSDVFLQQDGFMDKEQLTAADLNESDRPINQHWSWDRILRSVFIKQADVLQGLYFFWDHFSASEIEANYAFYEPKTLHESSLSPCVHAVLAARLNRKDEAYAHYLRTARLDLDDYNNEINEGLHITSMAGTWLSVVEGFGGFRVIDGTPCFDGMLPAQWEGLSFRIQFRGRELSVSMDSESTRVSLLEGLPLDIKIGGERQRLTSVPKA